MNEQMRSVKNDVLTSIKNEVDPLFKESEKAEPITYKNGAGTEAIENPGAYSPYMTQLIIRDIMHVSMLMIAKDEKASDTLQEIAMALEEKDLALRRMFDDRKDKRPVIEYPYGDTASFIEKFTELSKNNIWDECPVAIDKEKHKAWVTRFLKLDVMAYYLQAQEAIDKALEIADNQIYDDEGNQVYGLDPKDAESVKIIAAMEQIMLKALIRLPAESETIHKTMDRIELMSILLKAIAEQRNTRQIERIC